MAEKFPNFHRLVPILYVRDLELEVDFYKGFGFEISYQGDEFPGFVGLRKDAIEFGLKERSDFDPMKARKASSGKWRRIALVKSLPFVMRTHLRLQSRPSIGKKWMPGR